MALTPINLDDLTWDQLVEAARARIATASAGEWTLHAPVDPGVTLLELFAAQFEDLLYRLDQPCEARQHAIMNLLGYDRRAIGIASTVVALRGATEWPSENKEKIPTGWIHVETGTLISCEMPLESNRSRAIKAASSADAPWLTTSQSLTALPMGRSPKASDPGSLSRGVELKVGARDRTTELLEGRLPALVSDLENPSETIIALNLTHDLPPVTQTSFGADRPTISLLIDLHVPTSVQPEWAIDRNTDVSGPSTIEWYYRSIDGRLLAFDDESSDGTESLRRPGIVRLVLPKEWPGTTNRRIEIVMRVVQPEFVYLPQVKQIIPNAVIARQKKRFTFQICKSTARKNSSWTSIRLRRPFATLDVSMLRDALFSGEFLIIPNSVRLIETKTRANEWHSVNDFSRSTPADRHFIVDRELSQLRFGDGFHGRLPGANFFPCELIFSVGGGSNGNMEVAGLWTTDVTSPMRTFVNVVPVSGGHEAESMPRALARVTSEARRTTRCVLKEDFEILARETPDASVNRSLAKIGQHPRFPGELIPGSVTVYIVPDLPPPIADEVDSVVTETPTRLLPSQGDLKRVAKHLDQSRLISEEVFVLPPVYEDIDIMVEIEGRPLDAGAVRRRIWNELERYLHPIHGGDGDGWVFGDPVRPSALLGRLQNVVGDDLRVVTATVSNAGTGVSSKFEDVPIGAVSLPSLRKLILRLLTSRPDEGGLA